MMGSACMYPLLEKINQPEDIKRYSVTELEELARALEALSSRFRIA